MKKNSVIFLLFFSFCFGWVVSSFMETKQHQKQISKYEVYLSKILTHDFVTYTDNLNSISTLTNLALEKNQIEANVKSIMVGQLYELMDITQKTEDLALSLNKFHQDSPSYSISNTIYAMGLFLTELDPSKSLTDEEVEKVQYIQKFLDEWNKIRHLHLPKIENEVEYNEFVQKHEETLLLDSTWIDFVNDMDKKTEELLLEKGVVEMGSYLFSNSNPNE